VSEQRPSLWFRALAQLSPLCVLAAMATAAAAPGCGDTPRATGPQNGTASPLTTGPGAVPTEIPSSGGGVPDQRPQMNAQALASYQQGMSAFNAGDLAGAKAAFQQATTLDPRAHQAFFSLGVVQERLRDAAAALSFRQAYTIKPDYEPSIVAHAAWLVRANQIPEAEKLLTQKQGELPKSAAVLSALADVSSVKGDTGNAQKFAQDALRLDKDHKPAMVVIARDHYRSRRLDLALFALEAILDGIDPKDENPPRDPQNAEARFLRGLILKERGRRAAAMEEFRLAAEVRPDLVDARLHYAMLLLDAGVAEQAKPVLEGAIKYDPDNVAAHLLLGDAYRLLQQVPDSKRELEWTIARDATLPQPHYNLALLYMTAGTVPGFTPKQQFEAAQASLKKFQELRAKGETDDSEELIKRCKLKLAELEAAEAPPEPPPNTSAAPEPGSVATGAVSGAAPTAVTQAPSAAPAPSDAPSAAPAPSDAPSAAPVP
jgi:tetratricopeptide (TPR) repeat protein